jgi:hypothetical protein
MSHSITVFRVDDSPRTGELLAGLAQRFDAAGIESVHAGWAQLWLPLSEGAAQDAVLAALDQTADDWREHIALVMREC